MSDTDTAPDHHDRSDGQTKLFTALAKAQAQFTTIEASKENDYYSSKYAPLDVIWNAVRPILAEHGLCIIQEPLPSTLEVGVTLRTTLAHTSGEWRSSIIIMPVDLGKEGKGKKAPAFGSAQSYARRYALTSVLGVATSAEDNDGVGERTGINVTTETAAFKGWMAWGLAQTMLMEKTANQKQLDRILMDSRRKMEGQPIPEELNTKINAAFDAAQDRIDLAADAQRGPAISTAEAIDPEGDIPQ